MTITQEYRCPNCEIRFEDTVVEADVMVPCIQCEFFAVPLRKEVKYEQVIELASEDNS